MKIKNVCLIFMVSLVLCACSSANHARHPLNSERDEPKWIIEGEPIEFENELWYPQDGIESFLEYELRYVGTYKNVDIFVDKTDVKPYNRLYTKFAKNKYRYFGKRVND